MKKQDIIKVVTNTINMIDTTVFNGEEQGKDGIGSNQFRELASICRNADCYEEIELLVQYNEAKDNGKSWSKRMKNGKTLAQCITSGMEEIKKCSDDDSCLDNLCLYFGYFYWNARIYAQKNGNQKPAPNQGFNKPGNYSGGKGNFGNNNNNKYNGRR